MSTEYGQSDGEHNDTSNRNNYDRRRHTTCRKSSTQQYANNAFVYPHGGIPQYIQEDKAGTGGKTFTGNLAALMMFSPVKSHSICIPFLISCSGDTCGLYGISKPWMLGLIAFVVEFLLAAFIILDQLFNIESIELCLEIRNHLSYSQYFSNVSAYNANNFFRDPLNPNRFVTIAQAFAIPLVLITQTELMTSMRIVYQLS